MMFLTRWAIKGKGEADLAYFHSPTHVHGAINLPPPPPIHSPTLIWHRESITRIDHRLSRLVLNPNLAFNYIFNAKIRWLRKWT